MCAFGLEYTLMCIPLMYTVHFPLNNSDFTLFILDCTQYTVHCSLYIVNYRLYNVLCTMYTVTSLHQRVEYTGESTSDVHCILYTVQFTLYTVHFTLYPVDSTMYTVHCTLYTVTSFHQRVEYTEVHTSAAAGGCWALH